MFRWIVAPVVGILLLAGVACADGLKGSGGYNYYSFVYDNEIVPESRVGLTAKYEVGLDEIYCAEEDVWYSDNYVVFGVPISTGDDLITGIFVQWSTRMGKSDSFFEFGPEWTIVGKEILGSTSFFFGPRISLWSALTEELALQVAVGAGWEIAGLAEDVEEPMLAYFSVSAPLSP